MPCDLGLDLPSRERNSDSGDPFNQLGSERQVSSRKKVKCSRKTKDGLGGRNFKEKTDTHGLIKVRKEIMSLNSPNSRPVKHMQIASKFLSLLALKKALSTFSYLSNLASTLLSAGTLV